MNHLKKIAFTLALVAGLCSGAWAQNWGHRVAYRNWDNRVVYRNHYVYRPVQWGGYYYPYSTYGYYPYGAYGYYPYSTYGYYPYGYGYYPNYSYYYPYRTWGRWGYYPHRGWGWDHDHAGNRNGWHDGGHGWGRGGDHGHRR